MVQSINCILLKRHLSLDVLFPTRISKNCYCKDGNIHFKDGQWSPDHSQRPNLEDTGNWNSHWAFPVLEWYLNPSFSRMLLGTLNSRNTNAIEWEGTMKDSGGKPSETGLFTAGFLRACNMQISMANTQMGSGVYTLFSKGTLPKLTSHLIPHTLTCTHVTWGSC